MSESDTSVSSSLNFKTRLLHSGKAPAYTGGTAVNPPIVRASTVLFADTAQQREMRGLRSHERVFSYGARGTPTAFALEDAVSELEGAHRTRLLPTGLAAIGMALLSYLKPGDHVLVTDSAYQPVRHLAQQFLRPYGIEYTFFAADGSDAEAKMRPNTRMLYAECPGSLVYEMCDLPALAAMAHARGALVVVDSTWGSGVQYRPLALGADVSIMAATKYLSGHSDVMMGTVATTRDAWEPLAERCDAFGMTVSPDDAWLVLRGLRSLSARLRMHEEHALQVAHWLEAHPAVRTVFCPALPAHPGHALWRRDCEGTNGLVSFELAPGTAPETVDRLIDGLQLFGLGASWGGYESLVTSAHMTQARSVTDWSARGPVVRLHIGLEDPRDLIADLDQAFGCLD
ncbi:cystathionine beta-lyase [Ottowia sp.]|jgi:cystathionine beta-lyase|uniref:cystathionine beta-lyase n=1 Tax=Ottowia sp. TaxID=1898956 RepID=UPI0025D82E85|nr:cystathionine beta-lyase [Ottowia sp.]MBK6614984.1 cystathionine beta-lyase [Ottowia sp.]MBK6746065.1 cystathionine beta-lyase [Ottowia sp.]